MSLSYVLCLKFRQRVQFHLLNFRVSTISKHNESLSLLTKSPITVAKLQLVKRKGQYMSLVLHFLVQHTKGFTHSQVNASAPQDILVFFRSLTIFYLSRHRKCMLEKKQKRSTLKKMGREKKKKHNKQLNALLMLFCP